MRATGDSTVEQSSAEPSASRVAVSSVLLISPSRQYGSLKPDDNTTNRSTHNQHTIKYHTVGGMGSWNYKNDIGNINDN